MVNDTINTRNITGYVKVVDIDSNGISEVYGKSNTFMSGGSDIVPQLLAGKPNFKINTLYLEFENNSPVTVSEPGYDYQDGIEYYTGLVPDRDYLRIPITSAPSISSSDETVYTGNQVTFFGVSTGNEGVNGLPFSAAAGSVVFGGALVASPEESVPSSDRVFARTYWTDRLFPKHDGRQIGVLWTVRFISSI